MNHPPHKQSMTTPLRIIFNVSSKMKEVRSLNECLNTGPPLTAKIPLKYREHPYAVISDISKAYHHINTHDEINSMLRSYR